MINQLIQIYGSLVYHTALEVVLKSCKVNVLEIVRRSVSGCGVIVDCMLGKWNQVGASPAVVAVWCITRWWRR